MIATKKTIYSAIVAALTVLACSTSTAHVEVEAITNSNVHPPCKAHHFTTAFHKHGSKFNRYIKSLHDDKCFDSTDNKFWKDEKTPANKFYQIFIDNEFKGDPVTKFALAMCRPKCATGPTAEGKEQAALYIFQKAKFKNMGRDIKCSVKGKNVVDIMGDAWGKRSKVCTSLGEISWIVKDYKAPPLPRNNATAPSDEEEDYALVVPETDVPYENDVTLPEEDTEKEEEEPPGGGGITTEASTPTGAHSPNTNTNNNKNKAASGATVASSGAVSLVTLAMLVSAAMMF